MGTVVVEPHLVRHPEPLELLVPLAHDGPAMRSSSYAGMTSERRRFLREGIDVGRIRGREPANWLVCARRRRLDRQRDVALGLRHRVG